MATPHWFDELLSASEVLASADRAEVASWRGESGPAAADEDLPPLTLRLAATARAFTTRAADLPLEGRQRVLAVVERVLKAGPDKDRDAVATGFLEALLAAWDKGFDLRAIWSDLGPASRDYCLAWNAFSGVDTPAWMRPSP